MSDERSTFETTRARLEDIVVQVRRKDLSLEQSLDMLEEAVRLVNQCNELIDQTSYKPLVAEVAAEDVSVPEIGSSADAIVVTEVTELIDVDGDGTADVLIETVVASDTDWGAEDAWAGDPDVPAGEDDDERE